MESFEATTARMAKAWNMVCPTNHGAKDWREPVRAYVNERELEEAGTTIAEVEEAVAFYTATEATTTEFKNAGGGRGWMVYAAGYRRGPAGP